MYRFGRVSKLKLSTCDERLQAVCEKALSYGVMDLTIIEGYRSQERQLELYHEGRTKIKKGWHNSKPSRAVDIAPYPVDWNNTYKFYIMAGLMFAAASELGVKLRYGGDWDGDFTNTDQTFHDLPHFELDKEEEE